MESGFFIFFVQLWFFQFLRTFMDKQGHTHHVFVKNQSCTIVLSSDFGLFISVSVSPVSQLVCVKKDKPKSDENILTVLLKKNYPTQNENLTPL